MRKTDEGNKRVDKAEERMTKAVAKKFEDMMGEKDEAKPMEEDREASGSAGKPEGSLEINPRGVHIYTQGGV